MSTFVDGNGAAGMFEEALGFDITTTTVTCGNCGAAGRFADTRVYAEAPGVVVRCAPCGSVVARLVRTPTDVWLDLSGARSLRVPLSRL